MEPNSPIIKSKDRKRFHLCLTCGIPLPPDRKLQHCEKCSEIIKSAYREKKEKRNKLRICFSCGKKLNNKEYNKCETCAEKIRLNQKPYNDKIDRKSKAPKLCKGGCGTLVDRFGKYCPQCKEKTIKEINDRSRLKVKNREKKINEFFLQLEIEGLKTTGNYMGFNLKRIRELKKISFMSLAKNISINSSYLLNIEKGKTRITFAQFKEIMKALQIDSSMFKLKDDKLFKKLFILFQTEVMNVDFLM